MIQIQIGDIFCANHGSEIAAECILAAEKFWSADRRAKYSHAGIITSTEGDTFEALSEGVKRCSLQKYEGKQIKIIRPEQSLAGNALHFKRKRDEYQRLIQQYDGKRYPWWRIPLHIIPPLARFIRLDGQDAVCSEIVGLYLFNLGCIIEQPFGLTPDNISDIGTTHRTMEVVYEGIFYKQVGQATNLTNNQEHKHGN